MVATALKGDYSVDKVAQELRNQWPEADLRRRDQQFKATGFLGSGQEAEREPEDILEEEFEPLDLDDDGMALWTTATQEVEAALATYQAAKRTLKEARAKQHQVRQSRRCYRTSGGKGRDENMTCLRCGKVGHRAANCTEPAQDKRSNDSAPFVCYAEQATQEAQESALSSSLSTTQAVSAGMGVLDSGATRTLGSVSAIESVMRINQEKRGCSGVEDVDVSDQPIFGFADSGEAQCVSTVQLLLRAAGQKGFLRIHALDKGCGPILISVSTLRALGAVLDFSENLLVLRAIDPKRIISLKTSSTGHQLLDLTEDLFRNSQEAASKVPSLRDFLPGPQGREMCVLMVTFWVVLRVIRFPLLKVLVMQGSHHKFQARSCQVNSCLPHRALKMD